MSEMNITSVQYMSNVEGTGNADAVIAVIDSAEMVVPIDTSNRHYQAILEWVADGNTIQDAD